MIPTKAVKVPELEVPEVCVPQLTVYKNPGIVNK
jgi:hypothetical protein